MPTKPKPTRGRPVTLPKGTRLRGYRVTDAEDKAIRELLVKLRKT